MCFDTFVSRHIRSTCKQPQLVGTHPQNWQAPAQRLAGASLRTGNYVFFFFVKPDVPGRGCFGGHLSAAFAFFFDCGVALVVVSVVSS